MGTTRVLVSGREVILSGCQLIRREDMLTLEVGEGAELLRFNITVQLGGALDTGERVPQPRLDFVATDDKTAGLVVYAASMSLIGGITFNRFPLGSFEGSQLYGLLSVNNSGGSYLIAYSLEKGEPLYV